MNALSEEKPCKHIKVAPTPQTPPSSTDTGEGGGCGWTVIFNLLWVPPKLPFVKVICSPPPPPTHCTPQVLSFAYQRGPVFVAIPFPFTEVITNSLIGLSGMFPYRSTEWWWMCVCELFRHRPARRTGANTTPRQYSTVRSQVQILSDKSGWLSHR